LNTFTIRRCGTSPTQSLHDSAFFTGHDLFYSQYARVLRFIQSFDRLSRGAASSTRCIRPAQTSRRKNICLASGACVVTASATYLAIFPVKQKWLFSVLVLFNWTFINVRTTVRAVITETISRYNVSAVRVLSVFDGSAKRGRARNPSRVTRALWRTRRRRPSQARRRPPKAWRSSSSGIVAPRTRGHVPRSSRRPRRLAMTARTDTGRENQYAHPRTVRVCCAAE